MFDFLIIWLTFNFLLKVTIKLAAVMGATPRSAVVYFVY